MQDRQHTTLKTNPLSLSRRYTESLVCYKEGLQLFLEVVQAITEKEKKAKYRAKASEYLDRSEKVQEIVTREKELGRYQEHYKIEANTEVCRSQFN